MPSGARRSPPAEDARDFLARLDHPLKAEILALDRAVRAADPAIRAGVKWNSLSWITHEWFGTVFLRSTDRLQVVLHCGAKAKNRARPAIPDATGLLDWRGPDRAIVTLGRGAEFEKHLPAFVRLVQAWIQHV